MATRPRTARSFITQDSFSVAPALLGRPLAGPWRRAAAMGIDLLLVSVLVQVGGGLLLGVAAAVVLLRISSTKAEQGFVRRWVRNALRFAAAAIILVALIPGWGILRDRGRDDDDDGPSVTSEALQSANLEALTDLDLSIVQTARLVPALITLPGE